MASDSLLKELNIDGVKLAMGAAEASQVEAASKGFLIEAWDSAKYTALQAPIHGITQLIDRNRGTHLTEALTFVSHPHEAKSFSDWHAQQIGGALGMILPFVALNFGVHKGVDKVLAMRGAQTAESFGLMSMRRAVAEAALTGGIYEGVFNPSNPNESLVSGRLTNATHGALTFGTLTASARVLHDFGVIKNRVGIGVASGVPAGLVSAESESLLHGKGLASGDDVAKSVYTFGMVGGVLSSIHALPLGDRSKATGDKAAETTANSQTGKVEPVEFRLANEQSRQALEAFRRGDSQTAWAEVLKSGEPKRLLVGHEGKVPAELGTRADWVATCNLPEFSPLSRKLVLGNHYDKPMFMELFGDKVRFTAERMSPEAVQLGPKENLSKVVDLLDANGLNPESLPKWLGNFKPTGQVWQGNNSTVLELAPRDGFPDVVLKIKRGDFEGQRDWEADIYNKNGQVDANAVHQTSNAHTDEPLFVFLEDRVDYNHPDTNGYSELMDMLAGRGLEISDPGSGPPVGRSRNSGQWVVADRDAVSKIGSGEHQVEQAFASGAEEYNARMEAEEAADNARYDKESATEIDAVELADAADAKAAIARQVIKMPQAERLFPTKPGEAIQSLISQMTDGMSSKEDAIIMQQYAFANGDAAVAKAQIKLLASVLKANKVGGLNDWVR